MIKWMELSLELFTFRYVFLPGSLCINLPLSVYKTVLTQFSHDVLIKTFISPYWIAHQVLVWSAMFTELHVYRVLYLFNLVF